MLSATPQNYLNLAYPQCHLLPPKTQPRPVFPNGATADNIRALLAQPPIERGVPRVATQKTSRSDHDLTPRFHFGSPSQSGPSEALGRFRILSGLLGIQPFLPIQLLQRVLPVAGRQTIQCIMPRLR